MKCICDIENNQEEIVSKGSWNDIYIGKDLGGYYLEACGEGMAIMRIKYCPYCGRDLSN